MFAFVSAPPDMHLPSHCSPLSIGNNGIGDKGASALAAVLKKTRISELKCATTPALEPALSVRLLSAPADTHLPSHCAPTPIPRSIEKNRIGAEGASALAAVLKETKITTLR